MGLFKKTAPPPPSVSISPEERSRLEPALADLAAIAPKARADIEIDLKDMQGMWQLLAPSEEITWLQGTVFCTNPDGVKDPSWVAAGVLALTDQHLAFTGTRRSVGARSARWALTELSTIDVAHKAWAGKLDILLVGTASTQMGFAMDDRTATREFVSRLRTAIARAPELSARAQVTSAADELAKWARLRDDGAISDEEYAKQKAKLLGR